jgi:hypothetical protein
MAAEPNDGVRHSTLYSLVASLYLAALLVLVASSFPIDHWFRYFALALLAGMEVVFLVLARRARKAERRAGEKPPA